MAKKFSFRFLDDELNQRLLDLVRKSDVQHRIDKHGTVHYTEREEQFLENDLICMVRDQVFASWQILCCPKDWTDRYRTYMIQHAIPFREELSDDEVCFLLPRNVRPHSWKLPATTRRKKAALLQ